MKLKNLEDIPPWEWPPEAAGIILDALRNDRTQPADRFLAIELAGESGETNDEIAGELLSILKNSNESIELRERAAIALGPGLEYADIYEFDEPEDVMITEPMFRKIQETLHRLYLDAGVPVIVRRRILETSVRAPAKWHPEAVRAAYRSDDEDWRLTAVFCMQYVKGFDEQILEAIGSRNPDIHYEAVFAAGNWEIDAAWPHIAELVSSEETPKDLRLAAIEAAALIRPDEAAEILGPLMEDDDQDVVDTVYEALSMAGEYWDDEEEDDDDDGGGRTLH